jgi:two-component system, cell cycle sensor histidine kinase and response regulator CckA
MEAETLQPCGDTLLFVDDDPLMTELFLKSMSKHGFQVLTASSGAEALRTVEQEQSRIRLVLTDMTMPAMDGLALAAELGRVVPTIPVMLATGHDVDTETTRALPNVVAVVRKPYQNRVLAERIREILAERNTQRHDA